MAGDWIPMRLDLAEDPAVVEMADLIGESEVHVVGYLHKIWSWASRHCHDGSVTGVTLVSLARLTASGNVPDAMARVGWLEAGEENGRPVLRFPHWERWMSQSAKRRVLATNRKQRSRRESVTQASRTERDKSATREEKRREEYTPPPPTPSQNAAGNAPGGPHQAEEGEGGDSWTDVERSLSECGLKDVRGALDGARELGLTLQTVRGVILHYGREKPRYDAGALYWRLTRGSWPERGNGKSDRETAEQYRTRMERARRDREQLLEAGRGAGHDPEGLGTDWRDQLSGNGTSGESGG